MGLQSLLLSANSKGIIRYNLLGLGFEDMGLCPIPCPQTPTPSLHPLPIPKAVETPLMQGGKAHRVVSRDLASSWGGVAQPGDSPTGKEVMCQLTGGMRGHVGWESGAPGR